MKEFELVLPCYNEAKSLRTLVERTVKAAREAGFDSSRFQLLIVENGSNDNSKEILSELEKSEWALWIRIVQVKQNVGYGHGVFQGLTNTEAPIIGWSHADQQCDPKDAFIAFSELKNAGSMKVLVKGTRSFRNWKDRWVTHVFEVCAFLILGVKIKELNAQPKVFTRELLSFLKNPPNHFGFDLFVLYCALRQRYEIRSIPVLFPPRVHGVSNWASSFCSRYKTILGMLRYMIQLSKVQGRL